MDIRIIIIEAFILQLVNVFKLSIILFFES